MDAMKVLVTGWFSFVDGEATAGDLLAREVACGWLERDGPTTRRPDLAFLPPFLSRASLTSGGRLCQRGISLRPS